MKHSLTIDGIKYTLALSVVLSGFQVALAVVNPLGYVDNHYTSVFKTFENYWDAEEYYSKIYRYNTGKELEA